MQDFRIIFQNDQGGMSIIIPAPGVSIEEAAKAVPFGKAFEVVPADAIPSDRTFREAWCHCPENKLKVDVDKAKNICHQKRRAARSEEFKPLDVEATIPLFAAQAEEKRQVVRDKYAALQTQIDQSNTPEELKTIIEGL